MDVPGIVQSELDGEDVAASVSLGSEDVLYVTPTRTLIYRSDGLLSDESVEEYPHDAERVTINEGRRKTRITLEYSIDGTRDFAVPSSVADEVLHPVLAGVLNGTGITDPGETVVQTFLFSELTLIVTSERLVKHVGSSVWDDDYEEYHFEDVTGLDFEDGSVATQIVIEDDGRPQRIKIPNEHVAEVRERLTQALFAYYNVDSLDELNALVHPAEDADDAGNAGGTVDFGEGVDPLGADTSSDRPADTSGNAILEDDDTESLIGDPLGDDPAGDAAETADAGGQADATSPADTGGQAATAESENPRAPVGGDDDTGSRVDLGADTGDAATTTTPTEGDATDAAGTDVASSTDTTTTEPEAADPEAAETETAEASTADADEADESEFEAAGFEPATQNSAAMADLNERIDTLEARVDAQNQLLERQQSLLEQLIEELRNR